MNAIDITVYASFLAPAPPTNPAGRFPGLPLAFTLDNTDRVDVTHRLQE